jgi:hypothetical protein
MTQRIGGKPIEFYHPIGLQKLGNIKERKKHKRVQSGCSVDKRGFGSPGYIRKQMKKTFIF